MVSEPVTVRDEVVKTRVVVTIGPVDRRSLGDGFGWFIKVRSRGGKEARDRGVYGTCIICRHKFDDDDPIHMVGNVVRNGKHVGKPALLLTLRREARHVQQSNGGRR